MKPLYIYILLILVIAAGAYYLLGDFTEGGRPLSSNGRLLDIDPDMVTGGVYISGDSTRIVFERSGSGWVVTEPVRTAGAINILDDMIENISAGIVTERIENPEDLSEFGLDTPSSIIILYSGRNERADTIRIGSRAPTSSQHYTSINSSKDVLLSNEILSTTAGKSLFHLRNKKFLNLNPELIERLQFISKVREFSVERTDAGWLLEDTGVKLRERYFRGYLKTLDRMLIYRFIPGTVENYGKFGLTSPPYIINIDSYQENISFQFGSRVADMIYASRESFDHILMVKTDILRIFSERYEFIFDLSVTAARRSGISSFSVKDAEGEIRFRKVSGGGWTADSGAAADDALVESLLESIFSLQFSSLPVPGKGEGANGRSGITVIMESAEGASPDSIVLFRDPDGIPYCWSESSAATGRISAEQYSSLVIAAEPF